VICVPLLAMALAFGAVGSRLSRPVRQNGSQARKLSGDDNSMGLRREDKPGVSYDLLSPDLQRSTTLERVKKRLKQRDPFSGIRIKRCSPAPRQHALSCAGQPPKGPNR